MDKLLTYDNTFLDIENSNKNIIFLYFFIILVFLSIFLRLNIELNVILGLVLAVILILYFNTKNQFDKKEIKNIYDKKESLIRPKSKKLRSDKYPELVDFIFSIQDMYKYNVPAYEEMILTIDDFLELYEQSKITFKLAGMNYNLAEEKRRDAVNALHSLIYGLPTNKQLVHKLEESTQKLYKLLGEKLDDINTINTNYILINGYSVDTIITNRGPHAVNFYSHEPYTYDIY